MYIKFSIFCWFLFWFTFRFLVWFLITRLFGWFFRCCSGVFSDIITITWIFSYWFFGRFWIFVGFWFFSWLFGWLNFFIVFLGFIGWLWVIIWFWFCSWFNCWSVRRFTSDSFVFFSCLGFFRCRSRFRSNSVCWTRGGDTFAIFLSRIYTVAKSLNDKLLES